MNNLPKVCELCGEPTPAASLEGEWYPHAQIVTAAKRCFTCWTLEDAVQKRPDVARKILSDLEIK